MKINRLMLLNRWFDTSLHDFHGHGDQNCVFSDWRNFGAAASARAGASRPLHQNYAHQKKHNFDPRVRANHVK